MRRRAKTRHSTEPSLFPFLAVLICMLGALVVLLVLVVQQARVHASVLNDAQLAEAESENDIPAYDGPTEVEIDAEHSQWRVGVLREQRDDVLREFEKRRAMLTHLEGHIRELQDRAKALEAELDAVGNESIPTQSLESKEAQLAGLRRAIASSAQKLAQLKTERSGKPAFAILPFGKGNGTRRRPIYLECVEEGIVIQPEGILLPNEDFDGALGPGNPLDAALRATREFWRKTDPIGAANAYPLLVVRPKGTVSYSLGRSAIAAWDDEFGYELVSGEMELAFPEKNDELEVIVRRAIEDARQRQKVLQRAMPAHPRGGGFVVSRNGGLVPIHGGSRSPRSKPRTGAGDGDGGDGVGRGRASQQYGARQQEATKTSQESGGGKENSKEGGRRDGTASSGATNGKGTPGQGKPGQGQSGRGGDPLAGARGANWALPGGGPRGTAYTNPIRIAVTPEAIVLLPNNRQREVDRIFAVGGNLTKTVDQLVVAIHQRIDSWGLAPSGGYWQPELRLDVSSNAEELTQHLETLLQGSGLTLRRNGQ